MRADAGERPGPGGADAADRHAEPTADLLVGKWRILEQEEEQAPLPVGQLGEGGEQRLVPLGLQQPAVQCGVAAAGGGCVVVEIGEGDLPVVTT